MRRLIIASTGRALLTGGSFRYVCQSRGYAVTFGQPKNRALHNRERMFTVLLQRCGETQELFRVETAGAVR